MSDTTKTLWITSTITGDNADYICGSVNGIAAWRFRTPLLSMSPVSRRRYQTSKASPGGSRCSSITLATSIHSDTLEFLRILSVAYLPLHHSNHVPYWPNNYGYYMVIIHIYTLYSSRKIYWVTLLVE